MLRKEFLLTLAPALLGAFATRSRAAAADDDDANVIKHRFVMLDEARKQLLYEDQFDPAKSWRIPTLDKMGATGNGTGGGNAAKPRVRAGWGLQLVGDHCVLTAMQGLGWREYDLQKRAAVREVADPRRYAGAIGAARFPDGRTVLACEGRRLKLFVFDAAGGETSAVEFGEISSTRQIRRTPRGTLLLGSADERAFEVSLDGKILRRFRVPGAKYNFQVSELPNGHLLVAAGYAKFVCELDATGGKILRRFGGDPLPAGLKWLRFMAQFQVLKNGNLVVATWTGHGARDSFKGQQLAEFAPDGKVVWTWHDPQKAGSIHSVIVLDDLDTAKFHDA